MTTEERNRLITENLGTAYIAADKYRTLAFAKYKIEREDLAQEAFAHLCRVGYQFDPGRGVKFNTWAFKVCCHAIRALMDWHGRKRRTATHEQFRDDFGLYVPCHRVAQVERSKEAGEALATVNLALLRVKERHRAVLRDRMDGKTLQEISERLGVTKERVRQIEVEGIEQMRHVLEAAA